MSVCDPTVAPAGTVMVTDRSPVEVVRTVGMPPGDPSQVNWTQLRPGRFCPRTVSWPSGTAVPDTLNDAPPALATSIGSSRAGARRTIGRVASQSRVRRWRDRVGVEVGWGLAGRSSTQRDPSQNDMR